MKPNEYVFPIMGIVVMVGMIMFGVHLWYQIDKSIDVAEISRLINTNQTYVDELDCEKIIMSVNVLGSMLSPTQQDAIKQAKIDLTQVGNDKLCWD